jgi:CheY-like chemotaxis protein
MCVDDEGDILEVVRLYLEMVGGLEVICCHDGQEAIDQVSVVRPDLILVHVMRPVMGGPTTFQQLPTTPTGKDVPKVFMTARTRNTETEKYMRLRASGVVVKPLDPSALLSEFEGIWLGSDDQREQHSDIASITICART